MKAYLEIGKRRVFAVALDWPGWARSARYEDDAVQGLVEYGPRYVASIGALAKGLDLPLQPADVAIVERVEGNSTTDFGAPDVITTFDRKPPTEVELEPLIGLLQAAWDAFDVAADAAEGKTLRPSGPRGGGRSIERMREHVRESDAGYSSAIGGRRGGEGASWTQVQEAFIAAVKARARGELPDVGPRGGERWPARYAIRRSAWHALDHAWEIEDRSQATAEETFKAD
jgi:hypothetical protein